MIMAPWVLVVWLPSSWSAPRTWVSSLIAAAVPNRSLASALGGLDVGLLGGRAGRFVAPKSTFMIQVSGEGG